MKPHIVVVGALERAALLVGKLQPGFEIIFINTRAHGAGWPGAPFPVIASDVDVDAALSRIFSISRDIRQVIASSEDGVTLCDQLNHLLQLPWNDYALMDARRDKFKMQAALADHGIASIKGFLAGANEPILDRIAVELGYPVVMKPVKSAASDNVYVCKNAIEVAAKLDIIVGSEDIFGNLNTNVLIQEFVDGVEYVVDTVSHEGKAVVCAVWRYDKIVSDEGNILYRSMELLDPACAAADVLIPYALAVLEAVGIAYGPSHQEMMIVDGAPVLIEVGARAHGGAGGYFGAEVTGHSVTDVFVDMLTSREIFSRYQENGGRYATNALVAKEVFLIAEAGGIVVENNFMAILPRFASFFQLKKEIEVGCRVDRTVDLITSPTSILLVGDKLKLKSDEDAIYAFEKSGAFYTLA